MRVILASASKRRQDLLKEIIPGFEIIPSLINEKKFLIEYNSPFLLAKKIALAKAEAVKDQLKIKDYLIIGADTFVVWENQIFGKPLNYRQAMEMLLKLNAKTHSVITGMAILTEGKQMVQAEETIVQFRSLKRKEIKNYLDAGTFLDRAGAYGIQDEKCDFLESYQGSYTNILGLPLEKLKRILIKFGLPLVKN